MNSPNRGGLRSPVSWAGDAIEIIDQTKLPATLEVLRLTTVEAAIDAIRRLAVRGAPAIGACGGLTMALGLRQQPPASLADAQSALDQLAERIGAARPTAVNLSWAVRRVREAALAGADVDEVGRLVLAEGLSIIDEDREACRRMCEAGRVELAGKTTLLTHCNTGRLATMGWGTALGVVYAKAAAGEPVKVFASESRPLLQGARLTAWELVDAGIDVTLIADSATAALLASGKIEAVIVGADRIARNGDTANKIGTLLLAIAARHAGVPFYVAAPSSTFDPALETGADCVIEERPADEVRTIGGQLVAPAGVQVWNPAFDVTPRDLISGFISDAGVVQPPFDVPPAQAEPGAGMTAQVGAPAWQRQTQSVADAIRLRVFEHVLKNGEGYLSQTCSSAEIFAMLYTRTLRLAPIERPLRPGPFTAVPGPRNPGYTAGGAYNGERGADRDRFIFSPAHYALALYAALIEVGRLAPDALDEFNRDGSTLEMIGAEHSPGIELTTGSLAQALSQAAGIALARKKRGDTGRVWVMLSDGEFEEGQTWEALASAAFHHLDNLRVVVDANGQQCDGRVDTVCSLEPLVDRVRAFGATAVEVDGHDLAALDGAMDQPSSSPHVVIARTDPVRGVPLMSEKAPLLHTLRFTSPEERARYQAAYEAMRR